MKGIKNGMVMQRGSDNTCQIILRGEKAIVSAGYAADGETFDAKVTALGKGCWKLSGIPTGGPYQVYINEEIYTDIWVGDVWILAGQSNMEGLGWLRQKDKQFQGRSNVRALLMTDEWAPAKHPLHNLSEAVDKIHAILGAGGRPGFNCVGPGLAFALKMQELTNGVPQGLICCAHGGSSMEQWSPALRHMGGESLYGAMLRRVIDNGSSVRGMFWYQGCSDTYDPPCGLFTTNMQLFVQECRRDFGEDLAFVQVQLGRHTDNWDTQVGWRCWNSVRDQQRRLGEIIPNLSTVSAIGKSMDDGIHLSAAGQDELGKEAAEAMYHLVFGTDSRGCLPPPKYEGHRIVREPNVGWAVIEVLYANLHGGLISGGRPYGFILVDPKNTAWNQYIYDIILDGDTAKLRVGLPPEGIKGFQLYYGYGADPYCNITDMAGRSIPAMGPIIL